MPHGIWAWPTIFGSGVCALPGCGRTYQRRSWSQRYCCREHEKVENNKRNSARAKAKRKARRANG